MWKLEMAPRTFIVFTVGILLNQFLFLVCQLLKVPLWLDLSGTAYTAFVLGPVGGLMVGAVNNLLLAYFYYGASSTVYYLISAVVAVAVGVTAKKGMLNNVLSICGLASILYFAVVFFCAALTLLMTGGEPSDFWSKLVFQGLHNNNCSTWLSCLGAQAFVKMPDTVVTTIVVVIAGLLTPPPKEDDGLFEEPAREKFTLPGE